MGMVASDEGDLQFVQSTRPFLQDKTLFITGGSRGIGRAIALRAAQDGANVAIVAKTATPHPNVLPVAVIVDDTVVGTAAGNHLQRRRGD